MSRWETTCTLEAEVSPAKIWKEAYADAAAWPKWNAEIKRAELDGPLAQGAKAKIVFGTGLRLRFHVVEPTENGSRLTNTIYVEGPLAPLWRRILGPAAMRALPNAQRAIVELSESEQPGVIGN